MKKPQKTEDIHLQDSKAALLAAILPHVPFEGWSQTAFDAAISDSKLNIAMSHQACPRGALDLAVAFHRDGDTRMVAALQNAPLTELKFRDRITLAVRLRLQASTPHKEALRRSMALFALPQHAGEGAALLWQSMGLIWTTLGDSSTDINWYTKRATLSAVYSSTLLFWLGDTSTENGNTWAFLDRRISEVMQFEKFKSQLRENPLYKAFASGPGRIFDHIKAPNSAPDPNLPGYISSKDPQS